MKIGEIDKFGIPGSRDSVHVPIILAQSFDNLKPGDKVRFTNSTYTYVEKSKDKSHGIVDPFLKSIPTGSSFCVLLNPGLVDKLTHQFELNIDDIPVVEEEDDDDNSCRGCY